MSGRLAGMLALLCVVGCRGGDGPSASTGADRERDVAVAKLDALPAPLASACLKFAAAARPCPEVPADDAEHEDPPSDDEMCDCRLVSGLAVTGPGAPLEGVAVFSWNLGDGSGGQSHHLAIAAAGTWRVVADLGSSDNMRPYAPATVTVDALAVHQEIPGGWPEVVVDVARTDHEHRDSSETEATRYLCTSLAEGAPLKCLHWTTEVRTNHCMFDCDVAAKGKGIEDKAQCLVCREEARGRTVTFAADGSVATRTTTRQKGYDDADYAPEPPDERRFKSVEAFAAWLEKGQ